MNLIEAQPIVEAAIGIVAGAGLLAQRADMQPDRGTQALVIAGASVLASFICFKIASLLERPAGASPAEASDG